MLLLLLQGYVAVGHGSNCCCPCLRSLLALSALCHCLPVTASTVHGSLSLLLLHSLLAVRATCSDNVLYCEFDQDNVFKAAHKKKKKKKQKCKNNIDACACVFVCVCGKKKKQINKERDLCVFVCWFVCMCVCVYAKQNATQTRTVILYALV